MSKKALLEPLREYVPRILPESEKELMCVNKLSLFRALRTARDSRWVADWLFTHTDHPFHHHTTIPADAFDNALAIRGTQVLRGAPDCGVAPAAAPVVPGNDVLFVPVAHAAGRLIGYTFGGLDAEQAGTLSCGHDTRILPFFPHFVGRFAFDGVDNELLVVVNEMNDSATGVMSIRRSKELVRERSSFAVMNGSYKYKALPADIAQATRLAERRLASTPKYQFASGGGGGDDSGRRRRTVRTDMETLRGDLAKLERLVKGKFYAPQMVKDQMDPQGGELLVRQTGQVDSGFDVKDAVGIRMFRDTAGRAYYSYMASIASRRAAVKAAGK